MRSVSINEAVCSAPISVVKCRLRRRVDDGLHEVCPDLASEIRFSTGRVQAHGRPADVTHIPLCVMSGALPSLSVSQADVE